MAGLDMLLQGGRTAISPEFLRLLGVGLQDAVAPTLAEMMPTTAGAAGGGAALPLAGGAAALAALGAGGAAVNDMVVGRQRDPGGLLESLRAAAERDPRALPLYEKELRRMGGTPPAPTSASPPSVTPEAMELFGYAPRTASPAAALAVAKKALTERGNSSLGAAGAGPLQVDPEFKRMRDLIADTEAKKAALASKAAEARLPTNYFQELRDFNAGNRLQVPDPMYSRAISDAMLAFGGRMLANEGHIKDSVEVGGKAWMAGRNRNEDQAEKRQKLGLENFIAELGMKKTDAESLSEKNKAILAAEMAKLGVATATIPMELGELKAQREERLKREEFANRLRAAAIGAPDRSPSLNTVAGAEWLVKRTPEELAKLGKTEGREKYNKDEDAMYRSDLEREMGSKANEAARSKVMAAYTDTLARGGTAAQAYSVAKRMIRPK